MNNKARLSVVITLALGASVATWRYLSPSSPDGAEKPLAALPAEAPDDALAIPDQQELASLLSDPRVQTYFQRQKDKQALSDYFSDEGGELTAEEVWQLIETIEREGRMMAYEAMALKLSWLERNSASKAGFDAAARELVEEYRQKSSQSTEEYNPYEDVPGFTEYKKAEKRIVREVQQMSTFPNGMSRQEYLRERLLEAREAAYGS
ncbi:hypothetical protein [Microbulbifer taiwanensis]|uniref:Lipase modulator n=1 Tax=Microbulbifer taiwanensis TaxID=986746 RepID=A0ABW1YR49_9GAMM|nr:hypothetical protein [Microbulbifer taiwanensis]